MTNAAQQIAVSWGPWDFAELGAELFDSVILSSTFRVIGDYPAGASNARRTAIGSGFIVDLQVEGDPDLRCCHLVTAAHVLDRQHRIDVQIPNPRGGLHPPFRVTDWMLPLGHAVDIAIAPLTDDQVSGPVFSIEYERQVITDEQWAESDRRLGDEVHYVGILAPLDRPMVRSVFHAVPSLVVAQFESR